MVVSFRAVRRNAAARARREIPQSQWRVQNYNPKILEGRYKDANFIKFLRSRFVALYDIDESLSHDGLKKRLKAMGCQTFWIRNRLARFRLLHNQHICLAPSVRGPTKFVAYDAKSKAKGKFQVQDRWGLGLVKSLALQLDRQKDMTFIAASLDGGYVDRATFLALQKEKPIEEELGQTISKFPMYHLPKTFTAMQMELTRILTERETQLGGGPPSDA
jgi:hypothetical protein